MKARRTCAMLLALVLLFNAALMSAALAEEGSAEEQVLVFKTKFAEWGYPDYELAEAFNRTHPGKKIIIEEVPTEEALATELMSGKADYMLDISCLNLDASKCAASGLFVDLYEWMDADPDFRREDYYENLFEALEYDGHLYGITGNISFNVIYLNKTIAEAVGASYEPLDPINILEILDMYDAAKAQGLMAEDTPLAFEDALCKAALAMDVEFVSHVDLNEKTSHFSDPTFIELLKRTKDTYSARRLADGSTSGSIPDYSPFGMAIRAQNTSSLFIKTSTDIRKMQGGTLAESPEYLMGPLVFESVNGGAGAFGDQLFMVPASCSKPELAWEFIKFCIAPLDEEKGEKPGNSFKAGYGRIPVSKANLAAYTKYYRSFGKADYDTYLAKLEERIGEIHDFDIYKVNAERAIYSILEQYYDYGTITAEECGKQMDERLYLYLNE